MSRSLFVDGNSVAVRCWWASASGCVDRYKSAIERVCLDSSWVTVLWDSPGPSWRRELFPGYKAGRPPKPEAQVVAIRECQGVFPGWCAPGFEADDLVATFARAEVAAGRVAIVLSDDKDFLQLVGPRCFVVNSSGKVFDAAAVEEKFGVPPDRIRHLLSWVGDATDGLPGVHGYGPKKSIARALAGEVGDQFTYDLVELATVPPNLMRRIGC